MIAYGISLPINMALTILTNKFLGKDTSIKDYLLITFEPPLTEEELTDFNEDPIEYWILNFNTTILSKINKNNFTCIIFKDDNLFLGYIGPSIDNIINIKNFKKNIKEDLLSWLHEKGFTNFHPSIYHMKQ